MLAGSSGDPAINGAKDSQCCGLFIGASRVQRDDAGQNDETATLCGFDGYDDVAAAEKVSQCNAFEAKADGVNNLSSSGEGSAGGGADAPNRGVEFGGFAPVDLPGALQFGDAGNAWTRLVNFDGIEDEETSALMGRRCGGVEFSRVRSIAERVQWLLCQV